MSIIYLYYLERIRYVNVRGDYFFGNNDIGFKNTVM